MKSSSTSSVFAHVTAVLSLLYIIPQSTESVQQQQQQRVPPYVSPVFYLCNIHGSQLEQSDLDPAEVSLSVSIEGDPEFYVPGRLYEVTVSSSRNFDGFLLTGLYTLMSPPASSNNDTAAAASSGQQELRSAVSALGGSPDRSRFICSIVHSHIDNRPRQQLEFVWMAPPTGSGCVSFLATASLQAQLLFKDTTVLQLCEQGTGGPRPSQPKLDTLYEGGFIFRDDFESSQQFRNSLWQKTDGLMISRHCGVIQHGNAAVACDMSSMVRQLVTVPLNLSTASVVQFSFGSGTCQPAHDLKEVITVQFGIAKTLLTSTSTVDYSSPSSTIHSTTSSTSKPQTSSFTTPPVPRRSSSPASALPPSSMSTFATTRSSSATSTADDFFNYVFDDASEVQMDNFVDDGSISCSQWTDLEYLRVSDKKGHIDTHLVHLPKSARRDGICLRWYSAPSTNPSTQGLFTGCWAVDNVLAINSAVLPTSLQDDFDPVDLSNWIFFPGGKVQHECGAEGSAMVFNEKSQQFNYIMSRDVNLTGSTDIKPLFEETFEFGLPTGWLLEGGELSQKCSEIHQKRLAVFDRRNRTRRLCSPFIDLRHAATLRFYFSFGDKKCSLLNSRSPDKSKVFVYAENFEGHSTSIITLTRRGYTDPDEVVVPLRPSVRHDDVRLCWTQKTHGGEDWDVWAIDTIQLTKSRPRRPEMFLQFKLTLNCFAQTDSTANNSAIVEYSTDHGSNWFPLYEPCLPTVCGGEPDSQSTTYAAEEFNRWRRVTVTLPTTAMSARTRFRWRQLDNGPSHWALDYVFVGRCPDGCNGHGQCLDSGRCVCDPGFQSSPYCNQSDSKFLPNLLIASINSVEDLSTGFGTVHGATVGFACGVLASGKAAVFNGKGRRIMETKDLSLTSARYVQFSLRIGSGSVVGECPSPETSAELIFLQYTCNGGVDWKLLRAFPPDVQYIEPSTVVVSLPRDAQRSACRLRWFQPFHSGRGRDVWAVDDVSITSDVYNTIWLNFTDEEAVRQTLDVHRGKIGSHCERGKTLLFSDLYEKGESRYLITNTMHIGPSYVLQFEMVMGCRSTVSQGSEHGEDGAVHLEYSTDHGMTWSLVRTGCYPPRTCTDYHKATVYHTSEFGAWKRVTVILPPSTWSSSTRFRLRQAEWLAANTWALDSLYIGQQCPRHCHGHGQCVNGHCRCDKGYDGTACLPFLPLPLSMKSNFTLMSLTEQEWPEIIGGELAGSGHGCGTIVSGESLFFSKRGVRQAVTTDLDTQRSDFVQFSVQLGGGNGQDSGRCSGADRREEGILLLYSTNGGIEWVLLKELQSPDYVKPQFVHVDLPQPAKSPSTRFMLWQPENSGSKADQWAIDEFVVTGYEDIRMIEDDFDGKPVSDAGYDSPNVSSGDADPWLLLTEAMVTPYCGSTGYSLMLMPLDHDNVVVTKDMKLKEGDIIQFKINVGCTQSFSDENPVLLQFSQDSGLTWSLVREPCYDPLLCGENGRPYAEGTVYFAGPYGEWRSVILPVNSTIAGKRTNFRWWQKGGPGSGFALDDIHIGRPCPDACSGQGRCFDGHCSCEPGYDGDACWLSDQPSPGMIDHFEDVNRPSQMWEKIYGGRLGTGCGQVGDGNALYFDGSGSREARTVPLDTRHIRVVQFNIRIGSKDNLKSCRRPVDRKEAVIVDYSTNNGIDWHVLRHLDPFILSNGPQTVTVELPTSAKTNTTAIRWWQPTDGPERAQWALDDVIVAINDTTPPGFQENFSPSLKSDVWYTAMNAVPKITCQSRDNALEFSKNGPMRYAETWDYKVTSSSFLQFDIAMGCSGTVSTLYAVEVQYSVDTGRSWHPITEPCPAGARHDCSGYHLSNDFMSEAFANWTRVTLYLPPAAVSPATRFRWLQQTVTLRGNIWALDNIYLGDGCPWMCSGHGYCHHGACVCDVGYFGAFCVPLLPLPMTLRDDFENGILKHQWAEVYGAEASSICGTVVSGKALMFSKDNLRMIVTIDMDASMSLYLQFTIQLGCHDDDLISDSEWPPEHSILVQYSSNGGILWHFLHEIYFTDQSLPKYFTIRLPTPAQTNATRFRFWQPQHEGRMASVWLLDDVYIGGTLMNPDTLYDSFDTEPSTEDWLFWPGGNIADYCLFNTKPETLMSGASAMTFQSDGGTSGERNIMTRDLVVSDVTVIQFSLNVGCTLETTDHYPVHLEYSVNSGKTWNPVVDPCSVVKGSVPTCSELELHPSVYYAGAAAHWRRIIVPLTGLQVCGIVRFRWSQQRVATSGSSDVVPWAVDSIYIGMQCRDHCGGHGTCVNGMFCLCDEGYAGEQCSSAVLLPKYIKEDFEDELKSSELEESKWLLKSGGERSEKCNILLSGSALYFNGSGERLLETADLDLTHATVIQFFLKLGCHRDVGSRSRRIEPVLLQFSTNGGIHWSTIKQFDYLTTVAKDNSLATYIAVAMPTKAKTNSTRVHWWQPTVDGRYAGDWAIDQIYIGGDDNGNMVMQDSLSWSETDNDNWLMYPGAKIQHTCGLVARSLHFAGNDAARFAVTKDIAVTEFTYVQFHVAMGCIYAGRCYSIELQYSTDFGQTWSLVEPECMLASNVACTSYRAASVFLSDVYYDWKRVTIKLAYFVRSKSTRFRWIQSGKFRVEDSWALASVYIGDECDCSCGGHGRCDSGKCRCDRGWVGPSCNDPASALPTQLVEPFSSLPDDSKWSSINGGTITTQCGILSSGTAMHMQGDCTRQLITNDLDLRDAIFVQFYFRFGCTPTSPSPRTRDEGVMVEYSGSAGTAWNPIVELYFDAYANTSFVSVELPKPARKNGVRVRWWQPHHPGQSRASWLVDDIVIGGKQVNPNEVNDDFATASRRNVDWLHVANVRYGDYCGAPHAAIGEATSGESVAMTTTDIAVADSDVVEFNIVVGCNASWDASQNIQPVQLHYSTDYGVTWRLVVEECIPFDPACNGHVTTSSVYYLNGRWQRVTIPLNGRVSSKATRFRWTQSSSPFKQPPHLLWALDDVYIGPPCEDHCSGHGSCHFPHCSCDKGFSGPSCLLADKLFQTSLVDTFDEVTATRSHRDRWSLVQGGSIGTGCTTLVEGHGLMFQGQGRRQAVTVDLDLRYARHIEYYAMIGGQSSKWHCGIPQSREDDVIVQYSTDSGTTWHLLHILDHSRYWQQPRFDYILLPHSARTANTRLRWWQRLGHIDQLTVGKSHGYTDDDERSQGDDIGKYRIGWSLDSVLIGGMNIAPSELYENFDQFDNSKWEFHPGGVVQESICSGRVGSVMAWSEAWNGGKTLARMITTGQLIIQEDFMLQFKIVIGCRQEEFQCDTSHAVILEYNKDPAADQWTAVYTRCLPDGGRDNIECRPYAFHEGTIYSAVQHGSWTRITLAIPPKVFSSQTRFRWRQLTHIGNSSTEFSGVKTSSLPIPNWAIDDIYVGERCPNMCSGRGDCVAGECICDGGYFGLACEPSPSANLLSSMSDGFEAGIASSHWLSVDGGHVGLGCGTLLPVAHGKNLYFSGCGLRQAVTVEMDLTRASKVMFALQIGSHRQHRTCNVQLNSDLPDGKVLLQYTKNKGVDWSLIALHSPQDFLSPRKVAYDIPRDARAVGVQLRWWQPQHRGSGHDQWAVDYVEIIVAHQDQMLRDYNNGRAASLKPPINRFQV